MPPKAHVQRVESESSVKRARKSVERLSSSKLQANQYSPVALAGFEKDARPQDAKPGEGEETMPGVAVRSIETLLCHSCKRADDEDQMLLCDFCEKGWHMFCLPSRLSAIPEGDWRCPDCAAATGAIKSSLYAAASRAEGAAKVAGLTEDAKSSSMKQTPPVAKANGAVETVREGTAASHSSSFNAREYTGKSSTGSGESPTSPAVPAGCARWSRPVREEGSGGAWMVGRRVQIRCEKRNALREGRVQSIDCIDSKIHSVLFDSAADWQPERVNFGKVTWKLDRAEDCGKNPKTGRLIEESAQFIPCASTGFPVKRKPGRPRKNPLPQVSPGGTASVAPAPSASNGVVPVPARAVDPDACKVPLRKKLEMLNEALEDLPVYVAMGGARGKKGRREGTLEYSVAQQRLMVRSWDTVQSLEGFVEAQLGPKERPREHVFLSENDMPLVEHETTLSGYGREKLKDGTRVRVMFDNDEWYSGEVKSYDHNTARYHLLFEDGEEAACRHALFEPDDGFFLDNGKDCGMIFRDRVSTSFKAAQAAEKDADKDRWRAPGAGEEAGGHWLVGSRIRVFWQFDGKFHEAIVDEYNPDPQAVDTRNFVGPVHILRYDESKDFEEFAENLSKCVWNLEKTEEGKQTAIRASHNKGPVSASHGKADKELGALPVTASSAGDQGFVALIDEGKCAWTSPHWKFKTGGAWLVGRKINVYWDAERRWFAGKVLSYDGSPCAADSHGSIGPVHEVLYDDGIFFENLTNARWKLDANEGPSGNPKAQEEVDSGRHEGQKGSSRHVSDKEPDLISGASVSNSNEELGHDDCLQQDGGGEQSTSKLDSHGSQDTDDVSGDSKMKREEIQARSVSADHDPNVSDKQCRSSGSGKQRRSMDGKPGADRSAACSDDIVGAKRSHHGSKIVLNLPGRTETRKDDQAGDAKRNRESAATTQQSKKAKTAQREKAHQIVGAADDHKMEDAQENCQKDAGDELDLMRLKMEGRRWTSPDEVHICGGQWLLDRCVRLYWDNEAQWFPGIVVDFDGTEDAIDSHGHVGPVHTIAYEDGQILENLATATWQFDAKEGLAGVMLKLDEKSNRVQVQARVVSREAERTSLSSASRPKVNALPGSDMPNEGDTVEERGGKEWRLECIKLLGRLMRQEAAIPFLEPVDPVAMNIPDYLTIIKKPIDLGTVRARLAQDHYDEPAQVLTDIVLCFDNAIEYNPATEPAHKLALAMRISFASLCNGSQLLRPVLRCLDLSRHDVTKPTSPVSSPAKKSAITAATNGPSSPAKKSAVTTATNGPSSPGKKPAVSAVSTDGDSKSAGVQREEKSDGHTTAPERSVATYHEKSDGQTFQAAKRGGPRSAAANSTAAAGAQTDVDTGRVKIHTKGRQWMTPTGVFRNGGEWLVGRHIQVYWDGDETWFPGVVTHYDPDPTKKDSHDKCGPVHDVYYEDGDFLENLSTAKWQYDAKEGPAGQKYDLTEDAPAADKKCSSAPAAPTVHTNPRAACESCRQRKMRCLHMAAAAVTAGLSPPKTLKQKSAAPAIAMQHSARQLSLPSLAATPDLFMKTLPSPMKTVPLPLPLPVPKPQQLRGVKQDLTRKELEYQVVYAPGKTDWTVGLNKDSNFRELLLAFIQSAFPDRSVLHPWMPDFKKHMWTWGYREKQEILQGPEEDKEDLEGVKSVSGVQLNEGTTMYRTTTEHGRHKWHTVTDATSLRMHKMAANFLFAAIGVLSLHMGRDKHAKFLRHLGAYEEFERGWEAFEQGQAQIEGEDFTGQGPAGMGHFNGAPWQVGVAQAEVDPGGLPLFEFVPPQDGLPMFELEQEEPLREKCEDEGGHGQVQEEAEARRATTNFTETDATSSAAAKKYGDDLESVSARDDEGSNAYTSDFEMADDVDRMDLHKPESAESKQIKGGYQGHGQMQLDTGDPGSVFNDGAAQQSDEQPLEKVCERAPNTEIDACDLPHSALEAQNFEDEAGGEGEDVAVEATSIDA